MTPYKPRVNSKIYGAHVPYDKGYDAHSQRNYPTAEQKGAAARFQRADGTTIDLWVTEVAADFGLSGQRAQSRMTRQFYPRSFNDVTLQIKGNVASTQEYNRLALFVREHHWKALNYINQGGTGVDQTISFSLYNNTPKAFSKGPLRNVKGPHRPWQVAGYISTIAAGAIAHNIAPEFNIGFIVTESALKANTGLWSEILDQPHVLSTFIGLVNIEVLKSGVFTGYVPPPGGAKSAKGGPSPASNANPIAGPSSTPSPWSVGAGNAAFGSLGDFTNVS